MKMLFVVCWVVSIGFAQVTIQGSHHPLPFDRTLPDLTLHQPLSNAVHLASAHSEPSRFAVSHPELHNVSISTHGLWTQDGTLRRWRLLVHSPGAVSLSVLFRHFHLPDQAEFYVVGVDGDVRGAFTGPVNNKDDDKFAVAPVPGDSVILEYIKPIGVLEEVRLELFKVVHGFREVPGLNVKTGKSDAAQLSGNCHAPLDKVTHHLVLTHT